MKVAARIIITCIFMYSMCTFAHQSSSPTLPFSLIVDNSVKQEITAAPIKKDSSCQRKYGTKRVQCILDLSSEALWEQFKEFKPQQRGNFLRVLSLEQYELFLERIKPELWDSWYYALPANQQKSMRGNYAYHQKVAHDARKNGTKLTRFLAEPALLVLTGLVVPHAMVALAALEVVSMCVCADNPLEQTVQEKIFKARRRRG
jgi:hypothetical protein